MIVETEVMQIPKDDSHRFRGIAKIWVQLAVATAVVVAIVCCSGWVHFVTEKPWTGQPSVAEANARLLQFQCEIPESASDVRMTVYRGREPWAYVKFSAECSVIERWLKSIKPRWPPVSHASSPSRGTGDTEWWWGGGTTPKVHRQWAYKDRGAEVIVDQACETVFFRCSL